MRRSARQQRSNLGAKSRERCAGCTTFIYDLAGRMLTDSFDSRSFTWTAGSRLASVNASTGSEGYTYSTFGTRAKVGTRTFLRAGAGVTAGVLADGNADYTPGISDVRSGTTTYSHSGLKHMAAQSGQSGSVAASREYDAFGGTTGSSGSWQGTFGSGGEFGYEEDASALTYIGERHYDPSTGRFLSRDPVGWGTNWYAYCENDPVAFYDYQGEHPDRITGFTIHGWQSAWSHDGVGVKSEAMVDTIRNGKMRPRPNGTYRFDGPRSVVVLNQDGKVVTTWAKTRDAWRHQVRMYPQEPRVPGKALIPGGGRGSSGGAMGFFSAIVLGLDGFQAGFREVFFYRLRVAAHIRAIDEDKGEADRWEGVEG
jgi:RHS repeat-associated protein